MGDTLAEAPNLMSLPRILAQVNEIALREDGFID
jgi:hypothetical protein